MKIAIISDTHGYHDERIAHFISQADEVWHAGDWGPGGLPDQYRTLAALRGVYGNIDGQDIRLQMPEEQVFEVEGMKVFMRHIGGYPPKYTTALKHRLAEMRPGLFICGHSHIARVIYDKALGILHINPGAAGISGFHKVRTMVQIEITEGRISAANMVELGPRTQRIE